MNGHHLDSWPQPSGWRWRCECGVKGRGKTKDDTLVDHLAHLEAEATRTTVHPQDAADRRLVRLPDGRTGRLVYVRGHSKPRKSGAKARVLLPGGSYANVDPQLLTLLDETAGAR